jgi:hypothetical protein
VPRTSMKLAAVVLVGGLAVSACSSIQMGAAAFTGSNRISTGYLTAQVANLDSAYAADKAKGIKPQRPRGQEAQQVLTWLILFNVYDKMASQHGISVSSTQQQRALAAYAAQAQTNHLTLDQYWSAGAALPPDLLPRLGQAAAIQTELANQIDGGKSPTSSAGQAAVSAKLSRYQCLAAKDLGVKINPQYGEFDYTGFQVVPAPPTLAADPTPSPTSTKPVLTPPC